MLNLSITCTSLVSLMSDIKNHPDWMWVCPHEPIIINHIWIIKKNLGWDYFIFFGGGSRTPFFCCTNLLVRVKLGYPLNFNFLGKPVLGEKYVEGKKKKERRKKEEEE